MHTLAVYLLLAQSGTADSPVGNIVETERSQIPGVKWQEIAHTEDWRRLSFRGARLDDEATFVVRVMRFDDLLTAKKAWYQNGPTSPWEEKPGFSGFSIGEGGRRHADDRTLEISVYTERAYITVNLSGGRWVDYNMGESNRDQKQVEGLTRRLAAGLAGLDAKATTSQTVSGSKIDCLSLNGLPPLADLDAVARAKGWTLDMDRAAGVASIEANGKSVNILLASRGIRAGSAWRGASQLNILKDGKWYIPLSLLASL